MRKKIVLIFTLVLIIISSFMSPGINAQLSNSGIIRVRLASMGNPASVEIAVQGNYSIAENPNILLERKPYTISIQNNQLVLSDGITQFLLGATFRLTQHLSETSNSIRIRNTLFGWTDYRGEFRFRIVNGAISIVNYIFIETYLFGVVPFEMPNSWPSAALEAQAVAARTFALRSQIANVNNPISDLCDTQLSQVYRGFNANMVNSINAVNQTFSQVLMFNNTLASTFYHSSNGGMSEAPSNVWSGGAVSNLIVMQDPFDARNTLNPNVNWNVEIVKSNLSTAVRNGFTAEVAPLLLLQGFSNSIPDIRMRVINDISISAPNSSGRISTAQVTVNLDVVRLADGVSENITRTFTFERSAIRRALGLRSLLFTMQDGGDRYIFSGRGFGHGVGMSQFGAQQKALEGIPFAQILSFYYPGTVLTTFSFNPPTITETPSRGGDRVANPEQPQPQPEGPVETPVVETPVVETPTVTPPTTTPAAPPVVENNQPQVSRRNAVVTASSLNIREDRNTTSRRLGALRQGSTFTVIGDVFGEWVEIESASVKGFVLARHIRFTDNLGFTTISASRVNVRSGPGTNHPRLGALVRNERVEILERSGSWLRVRTNLLTGFIDSRFTVANSQPTNTTAQTRTGVVTASALNIRSGANISNKVLGRLQNGIQVNIIETANGWHKIRHGNVTGFVLASHIRINS